MIDAEAVIESGMGGARIDKMSWPKLLDTGELLNDRSAHNLYERL